MKKLELKLDELRVETFEVLERPAERGTVMGQGGEGSSAAGFGCVNDCFSTNYDYCGATQDYTCNCNSGEWACVGSEEGTCASCEPECA